MKALLIFRKCHVLCATGRNGAPEVQTQGGESAFKTALLLYKKIKK